MTTKRCLALIIAAVALVAAAIAGAREHDIYPQSGGWAGQTKHQGKKVKFKVDSSGTHVYDIKLDIPYHCANGTPSSYLIYTHPGKRKINSFNGYFYVDDGPLKVPGLTDDANVEFNGNFSQHGKRAKKAHGAISTDFDTDGGDYCSDRFDTWNGAKG